MSGPGVQRLVEVVSLRLPPLVNGGSYLLAFSGGVDSTVLLDLLVRARVPMRALHVHHGLLPQADAWAEHCRAVCQRRGVPFEAIHVRVERKGQGLEAAARHARYAALAVRVGPDDVLLTAQHRNDQAETFLLQLMRGAGPIGLSGMPAVTICGQGRLMRPLLEVERDAIQAYAVAQGLSWIEDPSNRDPRLDRAWLRERMLPLLLERWPALVPVMARNAEAQAEAAGLLRQQALADGAADACQSVRKLLALSTERRRNVLRFWLDNRGLRSPGREALLRVESEVLAARADASPCLHWPEGEIRRYRDQLYAMSPLPEVQAFEYEWSCAAPLSLPAGTLATNSGADHAIRISSRPLRVSSVAGGERIRPAGHAHHRTLKQLFQGAAVPVWVRERVPLLWFGRELIAVGDRWIAEGWQVRKGESGVGLRWENPPPGW